MITRLRREDGIGLPITMGVLLIVMILAGWALSVSQTESTASQTDLNGKRAMAAADAGLQAATWRLTQGTPSWLTGSQCVRTDIPMTGPAETDCVAGDRVSLGNGAEYSFVVTREYTQTDVNNSVRCAGELVAVADRCATATGWINGAARRRAQVRLAPTTFRQQGIIAKTSVSLQNGTSAFVCNGESPATIGSNGTVDFGNNANMADQGCDGVDDGTWKVTTKEPATGDITGTPLGSPPTSTIPEPGFVFPDRTDEFAWSAIPANNLNDEIKATLPAGVTLSDDRRLFVGGNIELPGGTYNFCDFVQDNGDLSVRPGEFVKIYIDSPDRPGTGCAPGTGGFWIKNNEVTNWGGSGDITSSEPGLRAPWLQVFVYGSTALETGTRPCNGNKAGAVLICNSNKFAGTIEAPNSKVVLSNSVQFVGAVAADKVVLENQISYRFPNGLDLGVARDAAMRRWTECTKTPPDAANPESGCATPETP